MAPRGHEPLEELGDLPNWNSGLMASDFDCSPAKHVAVPVQAKDIRAGPRTYGVGRVRSGAQPPASAPVPAVQRAWRFEEPGGLRVGGLDKLPNAREAEFWLRRAAAEQDASRPERAVEVLREALQRDVRPATSIVRALAMLQKGDAAGITAVEQEEIAPAAPEQAAAAAAPLPPPPSENDAPTEDLHLVAPGDRPDAAPHTVRKAFTPSRTGLTGRAQRVPSRFARTPGPGADTAPGGGTAVKGATAGLETAGVLKKLTFSVARPRLEAQLAALEAEMETVRLGSRATGRGPATTTKHLRFGATPVGATTAGRGPRHVTFDASVASPTTCSAAQTNGPTGQLPLATPELPAAEAEDDGSGASPSGGPSSTNTANAGHTPYDKRLSSLFRKYAESTPGCIAEDLLDSLEGALRSPSLKRLSTVSVPDSIKLLSQKYDAEEKAAAGVGGPARASPATSPPLAATPSVTIAAAVAVAAVTSLPVTPGTAPSTCSPATVAATPHDQLPGYLKRNAVYESPEAAAQAGGAAAAAAAAATATPTTVAAKATQQLTPNTAIAQLLGPVLQATIEEIEGGRVVVPVPAAAQAEPAATSTLAAAAVPAAGPAAPAGGADSSPLLRSSVSPLTGAVHLTPGFHVLPRTQLSAGEDDDETPGLGRGDSADIDLVEAASGGPVATADDSPASFGGFALPGAATPEITMADGVPRDAYGVPKLTPATVTVRRGRSATPQAIVASIGLAADLFGGGAFGSPTEEELRAQEQAAAARHVNATPAVAPATAAATPADTPNVDFSFCPASLPAQQHQQEEAGAAEAVVQADTPELRGGSAAPSDATPVPPGPSPEILGFYELQQAAAAVTTAAQLQQQGNVRPAAAATSEPEPAAEPLLATAAAAAAAPQPTPAPSPLLPRSIVKRGRPVNEDGTPVLGRAQRVTPGAPEAGSAEPAAAAAPPTITKELRVLMAGLSLVDREGLAARGSLPTLSPVRATGAARRAAAAVGEAPVSGASSHAAKLAKVITPVRRSARVRGQQRPLEVMLEETQYSYVPNEAMMEEEAEPKQEAKARKAANQPASAASSCGGGATAGAGGGQSEVNSRSTLSAGSSALPVQEATPSGSGGGVGGDGSSSGTAGRRYSTRSAARAVPVAGQAMPAAGVGKEALCALRTPTMMAHLGAGAAAAEQAAAAFTPVAPVPAASAAPASPVVADDASPQLSESPATFAAATTTAAPAARRYSLRESTLRKSIGGTPAGPAAAAAAAGTPLGSGAARANSTTPAVVRGRRGSAATPGASAVKLSPTEAGIRATLRSATKRRQQQEL